MDPSLFHRKLLKWYEKHKRDLPWRKSLDPYAIWVSEIMLQQTQVVTVIPYYQAFLKKFPNIKKLAEAPEEAVLAAWSGLGYYRRARLLHRGAKEILKNLSGQIPEHPEALKKIPSIGEYTAGAIASIAFQKPAPLVDGNVIRVYSRIFALKGQAKSQSFVKKIWQIATRTMAKKNPGDFNQALMELGATVCRPQLPKCESCPVIKLCSGHRLGKPQDFPERPPKGKVVRLHRLAALALRREQVLLVKRAQARWFQGMWELPHLFEESPPKNHQGLIQLLKQELGLSWENPQSLKNTQHHITHHKITTHAWSGRASGRRRNSKNIYEIIKFFPISGLGELALSNFDRKVLQAGGYLI